MDDRPSGKKSKSSKILRSIWFWIFVGLVLLVILFFSVLPIGIDYGIKQYLKDQGADQVSLADVDFNPLTGRMTIKNLNVTVGTQTALKIPEATFKIQWTPFIRKRFVLERFTISDTELTVAEFEEGRWQIGGIIIPEKNDPTEPASWHFSFQEATAKNCKIRFISAWLKSDLVIERAKISKLTSWMHADSAHLEFTGQLNDARMQLQLDVSPFGGDIEVSGRIKLNGLNLNPFSPLLQPHIETLEGRLDADVNIETRQTAEGGFRHHQKGLVKLQQVHTQIGDMDLSKGGLVWDGAIRADIPKSEEALKISADGRLNGSKLALAVQNENIKIQQDNFNWQGKIDYAQHKTSVSINTDGQISFDDVRMESPEVNLSEEKLTWKGALDFSSTAKTEGQRIGAEGTLDGSHLLVSLLTRKLKFEHQGMSWKGRLDSGETNDFNSLKAEADVIFNDIEILHSETNQRLLNSNRIDLQTIKVEGLNRINVSGIALKGLALLADPKSAQSPSAEPPLLRMQEAKLKDVQLSQQKDLAIDAVNLKAVNAFVQRSPQGKWPAIDRLDAIRSDVFTSNQQHRPRADQKAASDAKAKEKSNDFGFRIGQIEISGDSGLRFKDESVSPAFGIDLRLLEARLTDLDNRQPDKPTSVKLRISDGEHAHLSLDGKVQPFAERLNLDWVGKIESLGLPSLSPYVIQNTGYRFVSGEMQADIPLEISQNKLDGNIDLILYNPTVKSEKTEDPPEEQKGKIQLNMPLDSALKLLRDKQNNVKLKIPISGDIDDPQFSVAEAVNKVLAQTLQTSTLSYLKFMLGPYGIGLAVAEQAIKGTSKIRLNPILFEPGSDELTAAAIDYIQRVAAILKEHPAVQVSVCGVATESDRAAMSASPPATPAVQTDASGTADDALLTLAKERTKRIEDQLINTHGIATKRMIVCKPEIAKGADAQPRVDLEI